jgi:hypothetical protein
MMDPLPIAYTFLSFFLKKVKSYRIIPRKKVFVNKRKPSNVLKNKISAWQHASQPNASATATITNTNTTHTQHTTSS